MVDTTYSKFEDFTWFWFKFMSSPGVSGLEIVKAFRPGPDWKQRHSFFMVQLYHKTIINPFMTEVPYI